MPWIGAFSRDEMGGKVSIFSADGPGGYVPPLMASSEPVLLATDNSSPFLSRELFFCSLWMRTLAQGTREGLRRHVVLPSGLRFTRFYAWPTLPSFKVQSSLLTTPGAFLYHSLVQTTRRFPHP